MDGVNLGIELLESYSMNNQVRFLALIFFSLLWASCEVVGDIFEAGFFSGIFLIVLVVGCILMVVTWLSKKRR